MKILITTDWCPPAVNGVVRSVTLLSQGLRAQGHDVRILTLAPGRRSYVEGNVYYMGSVSAGRVYPGVRARVGSGRRLMQQLAEWCPDVVHSQCEFFTFHPAIELARVCGCPLVHTYHTVYEDYVRYVFPSERIGKVFVRQFSRFCAKKCSAVIVPTEKVKTLLENYGVEQPLAVVPTGVDLSKFGPQDSGEDRRALREKYGIPQDAFVLLCAGRIAAEKRPDELVRYFADVRQQNILLVFVGSGPYEQELRAMVKQEGLEDRVLFTGAAKPEEMPEYYRIGDIFVCASRSETQGLTYLEALASGLPAVCCDDECLKDLVFEGENGILWTDREGFVQAVEQCASQPELVARMSRAAVQSTARYAVPEFAANVLKVYQSVMPPLSGSDE